MLKRAGRWALLIALAAAPAARAEPKSDKPGKPGKPAEAKSAAPKVKSYDFSALDIEGRLKTPQLLYFLKRMEAEFAATTPDKRSFLPELKRSTDAM